MCGIAGFFTTSYQLEKSRNLIESMTSTLGHRGPDGWGTYISPEMALGQTRLSIVDLTGGKQPMITDRYVIVYNGEIFNHVELREELTDKGVQFKTHCDTEVALRAFETYGTKAFNLFNGQFALIIWDRLEKKAFIARDRFGVRPLYVLNHNGNYFFASEMKAFDVIDDFQRSFDVQKLFQHGLLWNTLGDATVYNHIRSVAPGTYEVYHRGKGPLTFRYYEIGQIPTSPQFSFEDAKENFLHLLRDAVRIRLRSDVPVAAYLSGGIDSSVISFLVSQAAGKDFKTFSVAFEDQNFDESAFQEMMMSFLQTEHLSQKITYQNIADNLLAAVYHSERPIFRTAPVPLYLLSEKVNQNDIKVVLTGEGADEILFGYDSFKELKLLNFWSRQPESPCRPQLIKKLYPHLQHYNDPHQYGLMKMYYEGFLADFDNEISGLNIRIHNNKILEKFFHKDHGICFDKEMLRWEIRAILPDNFYSWSILQQNHFLEMKSLLSGYLLSSQGDRMSMAHSVEGRYPFLDHRIVDQVFHLPDTYKLKAFSQKHLLVETFKGLIPAPILQRPKRPYMAPDLKAFFHKGSLVETVADFLSEKSIEWNGIFDKQKVLRFLGKFTRRSQNDFGYRDNMLFTFILTTQMAAYWAANPKKINLPRSIQEVAFVDSV